MMIALMLALLTLASVALVGWLAYVFFSNRTAAPSEAKHPGENLQRTAFSKILSTVSYFALFAPIMMAFYKRHLDLYALEVRVVGFVLVAGGVSALLNKYLFGRWA